MSKRKALTAREIRLVDALEALLTVARTYDNGQDSMMSNAVEEAEKVVEGFI